MWSLIRPKARHLVALAVFLPLLLLTIYLVTTNTDAYAEAARFVTQDARVTAAIGAVQKSDFKFWDGFEFTGNTANFSIEATSDKGKFVVNVRLRCIAGIWRVETADIEEAGVKYRLDSGLSLFRLRQGRPSMPRATGSPNSRGSI